MGMRVLAISGSSGDLAERAAALAGATGASLYEAQRQLASRGPRVLATYGDPAAATRVAEALAAAGFTPILLDDEASRRTRFVVRGFELEGRTLRVTDRPGTLVQVPFAAITALLRGVRTLGPDDREPFLEVHAEAAPVLALCERQLQYDGLHLERQATAAANFTRLVERLRGQAPQAAYDDRLNTRAAQLQVLGERLTPEAHLEIATLLLARALQRMRPAA
jgi:hypothetical protein